VILEPVEQVESQNENQQDRELNHMYVNPTADAKYHHSLVIETQRTDRTRKHPDQHGR
jgi:hypothetical protein